MVGILVLRCVLAAVFLTAGLAKLADRAGEQKALEDFGVPSRLIPTLSIALPLAETLVGLSLFLSPEAWWGALGACLLLLVFTIAISLQLLQGKRPNCHCFGNLHSSPVGWTTLGRNGLLILGSLLILIQGSTRIADSSMLDLFTSLGALVSAFVGMPLFHSLIVMSCLQALLIFGLLLVVLQQIRLERQARPPLELVALRPHG